MITDRLLHVHVPRTGGLLFRYVLEHIEGLKIFSGPELHLSHSEMCKRIGADPPPGVAFIRNPWEYYVSMWVWLCNAQREGFPAPFDDYLDCISEGSIGKFVGVTLSGAWEALGCDNCEHIGRFEHLWAEIVRLTDLLAGDLINPQETRALLERAPVLHPSWIPGWGDRVNRSPPLPYRQYYNQELRQQIAEWDEELIKRFEYEF